MKKRILKGLLAASVMIALLILCGLGTLHYLLTTRVAGESFEANGVPIHYTDEGEGFPIVLIHGIGANADINWRRAGLVKRLAKEFRVITFDLRGHGLSGKPEDPAFYGLEMIDDVPRLLDHLGIEKAHIAGYSLGGFITLKLLTRHPDRVQSAALCASGWANVESREDVPGPYRSPPIEQVEEMRRVASILPSFNVSKALKDLAEDYISEVTIAKPAKRALKDSYESLKVSEEELAAIDIPMICFMGTDDGLVPFASALKVARPDLSLIVLEGAGHITTVLNNDFRQGLLSFFRAHTPGATDSKQQLTQEREPAHAPQP